MSGSDFRIFHNVPWNPVPYLRSPLRESGSPRILFDRSLLLGWSFVAWKTGREWVFPEQGRDFAKDVDQECRTFLKKLVGGGNPHSSLSPPFQQGYVFLVPYETGEMLEPAGTHPLCNRFPLIVVECLEVVAYHHPSRTLFLPPSCPDILQDVSLPETLRERVEPQALFLKPTLTFEHYKEKILCSQERIARGDYFQLNFALSFDASTDCSIDYLSLYHHLAFHEEAPGVPKEGFKQVVWKVPADPAGKEKISCFDFPSRIVCPECLYWANADGDSGLVKQFWKGIPVNGKHHPDRWPLLSAVQTKAGQGTGGKGDSKQRWKNLERLEEQVNSFREVFSIRRIFPSRLFGCSEQSVQMAREKTGRSFPDGHGRKDRLSIKESRIEDRNAGFCGGKKCSVVDDQIVHASVPRFSRMVRAFA